MAIRLVSAFMELKYATKMAIPTNSNGLKKVITIKDLFRTLAINSLFIINDMMLIFRLLRFLNYLDITVDFDVGKLIDYKPMHETYLGYLLKHRSGIGGLINNVEHGGSNYNCFYIEKKF